MGDSYEYHDERKGHWVGVLHGVRLRQAYESRDSGIYIKGSQNREPVDPDAFEMTTEQ